jgi:hypothetical protein
MIAFKLTGNAVSFVFGRIMSSHAFTSTGGAADHLSGNAILIHFAFFPDQCVDSCRYGTKHLNIHTSYIYIGCPDKKYPK